MDTKVNPPEISPPVVSNSPVNIVYGSAEVKPLRTCGCGKNSKCDNSYPAQAKKITPEN